MKKVCILITLLFISSCASNPPIVITPELKAQRIAVVGQITSDISVLYQGVTVFENKFSKHDLDWDPTIPVSRHIVSKLNSVGFSGIENLTGEAEYGEKAKNVLLTTWSGGKLNPDAYSLLNSLAQKGFSYVIVIRDSNTFITDESSIPPKGVFFRKGFRASSVHSTIAATLISLKDTPQFVGGSYAGCPKEYYSHDLQFTPFATNIENAKDISKEELIKIRPPLEHSLALSADSSLCYYGLTKLGK